MKTLYPFFYQYDVCLTADPAEAEAGSGAMATVIVFAETDEIGRARAGRYIAGRQWRIMAVKRAMLIKQHHIDGMGQVLKKLYRKAEQAGICACFDSWSAHGKPKTTW